jgi:type III pantothenate kinase
VFRFFIPVKRGSIVNELKLLIDQGNTRLKWVLARDGQLDEDSLGRGSFEEFVRAFGPEATDRPGSVLLSSVADSEQAEKLVGFCDRRWSVETSVLESTSIRAGVHNSYAEPSMLGVDRWLAVVGAVARYGNPTVIWDLGTATTLDAVNDSGQHIGGMILPGPETMLKALRRDTRLKVPTSLDSAGSIPGRSTAECIRNGVFAAQVGALNQFLRTFSASELSEPSLVVTGGGAAELLPSLDFSYIHDPWLVFRGMLVE